jgi:uncharacterized protein YgiM (DUF1202 family)
MHKRTLAVLLGAILLLALGSLGCAASRLISREPAVTVTPTRTPRPTWTPVGQVFQVATPTLDATRYPGVALPGAVESTPQVLVPGSSGPIFVPVPAEGVTGVQTLVVVVVTATPQPTQTWTPGPPTLTPQPTFTPGPPTATPTATGTPLPPVTIDVTVDKSNVRQGPGTAYPVVTRLDIGTQVTVVGRNRNGDWWKICCVNGADVWIADSVVKVEGPLWAVTEISNVPAPPPTQPPPPTPIPTPTYAWPFRVEGRVQEYPLGQNYFRVDAVIYNGATPLYGYKLKIRKTSTGQEWLTTGSQTTWIWYVLQYPDDNKPVNPSIDCPIPRKGPTQPLLCVRSNVKWDSNGVGVPMGDDVWEVTVTDGAGTPISQPARIPTSGGSASKWYHIVFTSRP